MASMTSVTKQAAFAASRGDWLRRAAGLAYGLAGFAVMWVFWATFVIFLANAPRLAAPWIEPSVDVGGSVEHPLAAALIDLALIAIFGLQHSLMARPAFKRRWTAIVPSAFERATYVHAANAALFLLVLCWQPIPTVLWHAQAPLLRDALWLAFALGWIILFAGAWSFGLADLLGLTQIWSWYRRRPAPPPRLKTQWLYKWLRHPMYVGVLLGVWATPHMTVGHALLAAGFTLYVLIAIRYEERDLARTFNAAYRLWRAG
jgi:protein-S-isoprenylcysteine O-methyltransferase Ste14